MDATIHCCPWWMDTTMRVCGVEPVVRIQGIRICGAKKGLDPRSQLRVKFNDPSPRQHSRSCREQECHEQVTTLLLITRSFNLIAIKENVLKIKRVLKRLDNRSVLSPLRYHFLLAAHCWDNLAFRSARSLFFCSFLPPDLC